MDERVIKRGEVYWIQLNSSGVIGVHTGGRPAVVVSNDDTNRTSDAIEIVFMTTVDQSKHLYHSPRIKSTGKISYAKCEQVTTVSKSSVGNFIAMTTSQEMSDVNNALKYSLGLSTGNGDPDAWEDERRELEEEIASLKAQSNRRDDSSVDIRVERDMWKKMYEKALEMLVEKNIVSAKEPEKRVVIASEPEAGKRVETVIEPMSMVKVNINTASAKEIATVVGCGLTSAYSITGYRRKNGDYVCLEELRDVKNLPKSFLEQYGERLTI